MMTIRRRLAFVAVALTLAIGMFAGFAIAEQVHMVNARTALQTARSELQLAEKDKAGHRARALQLVNDALNQVNMGIRAGR
jgi:hypothetical protein